MIELILFFWALWSTFLGVWFYLESRIEREDAKVWRAMFEQQRADTAKEIENLIPVTESAGQRLNRLYEITDTGRLHNEW